MPFTFIPVVQLLSWNIFFMYMLNRNSESVHLWRFSLAILMLLICEAWLNLSFAVWFQYSPCIMRMFFSSISFKAISYKSVLINHVVCCQLPFVIDKTYIDIKYLFIDRIIFIQVFSCIYYISDYMICPRLFLKPNWVSPNFSSICRIFSYNLSLESAWLTRLID